LPFYLTNENIEATMERNPDDVFNPSDINHKPRSSNSVVQLTILQVIKCLFEKSINQEVTYTEFEEVDSLHEGVNRVYVLDIETNLDEYKLTFYVPNELLKLFGELTVQDELFLRLSNAIIEALNEEEISYLQDIELINLNSKTLENKNELSYLYASKLVIDNQEYSFYLQLDEQFNKIF